jgi:protein-disulfide isomerase-like protein with CxxC motif
LSPAEIVVHVIYYTDPACPWSWAAEPALRRIQGEFGDGVSITYVMGGLAAAALWEPALEFRARPERLGSGYLWAATT